MILVSLENVKKYSHVVARLPQRLKSTLFEIFSTLQVPFGHPPFEKISNNVDFSLWGKQCICLVKTRPKLWKSHIVYCCCYNANNCDKKLCTLHHRWLPIYCSKFKQLLHMYVHRYLFLKKNEGMWGKCKMNGMNIVHTAGGIVLFLTHHLGILDRSFIFQKGKAKCKT